MKKSILPFFALFLLFLSSCGGDKETQQENKNDSTATADTLAVDTASITPVGHPMSSWGENNPHHHYFNSRRVDEWVNSKPVYQPTDEEAMDYEHDLLSKSEISKLSVRELIYYCLKYPCSFSQICAADDYQDSTNTPKITAFMPFDYSGGIKSVLQKHFIDQNRDSVVIILTDYIKQNPGAIATEYFDLLLELKAIESIPVVIKTASLKNIYNYTFLMALMSEKKYEPFMQTGMYNHLYGDDAWHYGNRIEATPENTDSIKTLAKGLYEINKTK